MALTYIKKGVPDTEATRTGRWVRYSFIFSYACWQALSQMNETLFFINFVKGWQCPERFAMNIQTYASFPCNPLSFLRFLEGCTSWMARIFFRSRRISLDVTTNLRTCHWLPPRKILLGSSSNDALVWYQILSLDLQDGHFCCSFSPQYCQRSILLFYVYPRERLYSWRVDMLLLHSSIWRALRCSSVPQ